jgi:hypothetical protein
MVALMLGGWAYVAWHVRHVRRRVDELHLNSDARAMNEAKAAHTRIDRIDQDMDGDRVDSRNLWSLVQALKGRVTFMMHKDISAEIARQADAEKQTKKSEP